MSDLTTILAKLDELRQIKAASAQTRAELQARRDAILATVQAELDALKEEFGPLLQTADERAEELEDEIKELVRAHGQPIKTAFVSVSCSRPRFKWDNERLEGYAAAHPEILAFRSPAPPIVSIRWPKATSSARTRPAAAEATAAPADDDEDLPF